MFSQPFRRLSLKLPRLRLSRRSSLPPELVSKVLLWLGLGLPSSRAVAAPEELDAFLDLLACSLVSRTWHREARPLILNEHFRHLRLLQRPYPTAGSARLVDLLKTSYQLGLDYCNHIERIDIDLGWMYTPYTLDEYDTVREYYRVHENIVVAALKLETPYVRTLKISVERGSSRLDSEVCALLRRIAPLCGMIEKVELCAWYVEPKSAWSSELLVTWEAVLTDKAEGTEDGTLMWWKELRRAAQTCVHGGRGDCAHTKILNLLKRLVDSRGEEKSKI